MMKQLPAYDSCNSVNSVDLRNMLYLRSILLSSIVFMMFAVCSHASFASVDLLNPHANLTTSSNNMTFEYYVSMNNMNGCNVLVNGNSFVDTNNQSNSIHSVVVNAMSDGNYYWNVTCSNETDTTTSLDRNFIIDTVPPVVTIVVPQQFQTYKTIPLDFIPYDDVDPTLTCGILWNNKTLDNVGVLKNTHYARNYTSDHGTGLLQVNCTDSAGNSVVQNRTITYAPDFGIALSTDKTSYGIAESVHLTINAINGANISVDICPDQPGFVQCTTAILSNSIYPQTITLPYLNATGQYLVEATAKFMNQTKTNITRYNVTNTMYVQFSTSKKPSVNASFNIVANTAGGVAPYSLTWHLANGSVISGVNTVALIHDSSGTYTQNVIAVDSMNNTISANYTYTINNLVEISVKVTDSQNGLPIANADVSVDEQGNNYYSKTGTDGLAYIGVEPGTYKLFVSADGYAFSLNDVLVTDSQNQLYAVSLQRNQNTPLITLISPGSGATISPPASLQFNVNYPSIVSCNVYENKDGGWFESGSAMNVSDSNTKSFSVNLDSGLHILRIGCIDKSTNVIGTSPSINITASTSSTTSNPQNALDSKGTDVPDASVQSATGSTAEEIRLQSYIDSLDSSINAMDTKSQKEKETMIIIGYDTQLRNAKRSLQQYARDMSDVQFRTDLDDSAKAVERKRIIASADSLFANTPINIIVKDSKSFVDYLQDKDVQSVAGSLAGVGEFSNDSGVIAKHIMDDQQKFTISTKMIQADYVFSDSQTKSITVISRSFTYAKNLSPDYSIYDIIPKNLINTKDIVLNVKGEVLNDGTNGKDSVIKFGQEPTITYTVPKNVDFTSIENIKTVIERPYAGESIITGFAILNPFDSSQLDGLNSPIIIIVGLIILAYLVYYFDMFKHVQFLYYRIGKKGKLHYVKVMINDANDQLDASNYEKADMLFKEIHMTYDSLPLFAKNELYEDVMELVHKMDSYYFNIVMLEFDGCMKSNDLEGAISSYEKLVGVYGRLVPEQQEKLVNTISALASRLGVKS